MPIIGFVLFLAGYLLLKFAFGILICDDAYITLAHARSWNLGLGPIQSALNPVCATSTPLHTMLTSLLALIFQSSDFVRIAYFNNIFWEIVGFYFLYRICISGIKFAEPWAILAVSAYAFSINQLAVSAYGMETPMVVSLALAGTWFALFSPPTSSSSSLTSTSSLAIQALKKIPWGLANVSFFAPLARPEGVLIPAVLIPLYFWNGWKDEKQSRKEIIRNSLICILKSILGFILFFCFYRYAYNNWLPHSILAKRLEIHIGFWEGIQSWVQNVFYKGPTLGGWSMITMGNLLLIGMAGIGFYQQDKRRSIPWKILIWPFTYFLFFTVTRSSYVLFTWYYLPVLPFLIAFIVCGLERFWTKILVAKENFENEKIAGAELDKKFVPKKIITRLFNQAPWIFLFAFLFWVPAQTFKQHLPDKHRLAENVREGRYREAAGILDSLDKIQIGKLTNPSWVMIDEVGALGYYSHIRILDTHGLLSPEALPFLSPERNGYFGRLTAMRKQCQPEWIVGMRLVRDEGKWYPSEDSLYEGYKLVKILRRKSHGYNFEMWRRDEI